MTRVVASLPDGKNLDFFVHAGVDQFISARIKARGSWESFETSIIVSLLRPGDVFIDIGANIGWHHRGGRIESWPTGSGLSI